MVMQASYSVGRTGIISVSVPDGFFVKPEDATKLMHQIMNENIERQLQLGNMKPDIYADNQPAASVEQSKKKCEAMFAPTEILVKAVQEVVVTMERLAETYAFLPSGHTAATIRIFINGKHATIDDVRNAKPYDDIRVSDDPTDTRYFRKLEAGHWGGDRSLTKRNKRAQKMISRQRYVKNISITDAAARSVQAKYRSLYIRDVWFDDLGFVSKYSKDKRWPAVKIGFKR